MTRLGRFLAWLGLGQAVAAGTITVRVARNDRGGWSIFPVNEAACRLFNSEPGTRNPEPQACACGNFATEADALRRAAWNCWEVVAS